MILHKQQFQLLVWQGIEGALILHKQQFQLLVWQGIKGNNSFYKRRFQLPCFGKELKANKKRSYCGVISRSARDREEDSSMANNRSPEAHYRAAARFPPGDNSVHIMMYKRFFTHEQFQRYPTFPATEVYFPTGTVVQVIGAT